MEDKAELSCNYDLEGEELYSVKWYKDGNEFYRFIPGERDQKVTVFSLPGVQVDVSIYLIFIAKKFFVKTNFKIVARWHCNRNLNFYINILQIITN